MHLFERLAAKKEYIAVVGLGYVGLPLAVELAMKYAVIGFDVNKEKLSQYRNGIDVTNEVGSKRLQSSTMTFTHHSDDIRRCKWFIIAVPTPINDDKTPDLSPVIAASKTVGSHLQKDAIVVYESTVYPGTTEEICIPLLEESSGLKIDAEWIVSAFFCASYVNCGLSAVTQLPLCMIFLS